MVQSVEHPHRAILQILRLSVIHYSLLDPPPLPLRRRPQRLHKYDSSGDNLTHLAHTPRTIRQRIRDSMGDCFKYVVYAATPGVWAYNVAGEDFAHVGFTLMARFWVFTLIQRPLSSVWSQLHMLHVVDGGRLLLMLVGLGLCGEPTSLSEKAGNGGMRRRSRGGCGMCGERRWGRRVWWQQEIYG